jgi:O-methyltransferase
MQTWARQSAVKWLRHRGYALTPIGSEFPVEAGVADRELLQAVKPFTMTSNARLWALLAAVRYACRNNIEGDFVECGVWRGGSSALMTLGLALEGDASRTVWLYDTFQGMTEPSAVDIEEQSGQTAETLLASTPMGDGNNVWAHATKEDVLSTFRTLAIDTTRVRLIEGDVRQTLSTIRPDTISVLRLDTDFYDSTRIELDVLFPLLSPGGVCIIDDYGHWQGARRAVDEYFVTHGLAPLLVPIDGTGRIFVKVGSLAADSAPGDE